MNFPQEDGLASAGCQKGSRVSSRATGKGHLALRSSGGGVDPCVRVYSFLWLYQHKSLLRSAAEVFVGGFEYVY